MNKQKFAFGKNWQYFLDNYFNEERLESAVNSLKEILNIESLSGKKFIDIGCGSGLFSLAAYKLNAEKIISLDVDKFSIRCCNQLFETYNKPPNWQIIEGSILDDEFVETLEKCDVVYSWGVLHHTGNMWKAIDNAANLTSDNGVLVIAIYNKVVNFCIFSDGRFGNSRLWEIEKKFYNKMPDFIKSILNGFIAGFLLFLYLFTFQNPIKKIKMFPKKFRGMSWYVDIKDWIGGYPYEYADVEEIFKFLKKKNFMLQNLKLKNNLGNNEYVFKKI